MTTALYRKNGGEVIKISIKDQSFADANSTYWGVLTDPAMPDGTEIRDPNEADRVLGYAKIVDGTTVRNAVQAELDNFPVAELADENNQDADGAADLFQTHPRFRKMMIAFADIIKDEINILRAEHGLPDRTLAQLKTAISNRINKDN